MKKLLFLALSCAFLTMACTSSPKGEQTQVEEDSIVVDTDSITQII